MSDSSAKKSSYLVTFAAAVGGFAIFVLIIFIAYLPKKPEPLGDGVRTPAERKAILAEMHGKEHDAANTYGWVDQANGIVRIPIDEAVRLTIQDYSK